MAQLLFKNEICCIISCNNKYTVSVHFGVVTDSVKTLRSGTGFSLSLVLYGTGLLDRTGRLSPHRTLTPELRMAYNTVSGGE